MVIMEPAPSMSYRIKELLLRAWRERWSEIELGRNIKRLLPRSASGDQYDLADCILQQAVSGPVPNSLLISYLNHSLTTGIVTYGSVILAITKIQDPKPNCILCLLEFVHKFRFKISCSGNEDDCIILCRALVSLLHWVYQITSNLIAIFATSGSSNADDTSIQCIRLTSELLNYLSESPFLKALLFVGKLEEPALWMNWCTLYVEINAKLPLINDKSLEGIAQHLSTFQSKVEWLASSIASDKVTKTYSPIVSVAVTQLITHPTYIAYEPITYRSLQATIAFNAVLDPAIATEVIANQINMISRFFDIDLSRIYCESLQACITCLIDAHKLYNENNSKHQRYYHTWCAFFLFKIPKIFQRLSRHKSTDLYAPNELELGLEMLLKKVPLLDLFNTYYSPEYFQRLLDEFCKLSILTNKAAVKFLEARKIGKNSSTANDLNPPIMVARAEQTLTSVIDSFNSDNHETLLGILCRLQKSLEVMLCTTASLDSMSKFAHKLVNVNEMSKVSNGENLRTSQLRAVLFDISFLSLCTLVLNYGTEVVTSNPEIADTFFVKWCALNFGRRHSPEMMLNAFTESSKIDTLLSQFIVSNPNMEFKTSLVRWNDMCIAAQMAVCEILPAWCHEVVTAEVVHLTLDRLKNRICCLSLCAACWLFAQLNVASQPQSVKIMSMLNELKSASANTEKNAGDESIENAADPLLMYYGERVTMLQMVMKRLFEKHLPHTLLPANSNVVTGSRATSPTQLTAMQNLSPVTPLRLSYSFLNVLLDNTFAGVKGTFGMKNIYDFDGLMMIGGPSWFVNGVIRKLFDLEGDSPCETFRLQQAVDLSYGLFQLDLEQCAMVLLRETIPRLLLYQLRPENEIGIGIFADCSLPIPEPKVTALVRLAIMSTFGAIEQIKSLQCCGLGRRSGSRKLYEDISERWMRSKVTNKLLKNTACFYQMQQEISPNVTNTTNVPGAKSDEKEANKNSEESMDVDSVADMKQQQAKLENHIGLDLSENELLNEPLYVEFIRFLNLLMELTLDSEWTPRSMVMPAMLEQIVLCLRDDSPQLLQFVPFRLLNGIIRSTYDLITFEQLLAYLSLTSGPARKIGARLLCQLEIAKSTAANGL